jgi:hypothetical protein
LKLADLITTVETMWTPSAPPNDPIPSSSVSKEDKSTAAPPPVPTLPVTHHQSAEAQTPNQLDPATMIKFWGAGRPLELWSPKHKVWEPVVVASAKLPSYLNVRFSAASKFDTTGFNTTGFNTKEATAKETKDVKEINSTIDVSKEGGRLRLPRNLNIVSERYTPPTPIHHFILMTLFYV